MKKVPELRFKEFSGEWEERKLGEVADVRDGTHDSPKYLTKGYPLVTSKHLINGKIDLSDINYISKDDYININKRSKVNNGDILMGMIGTIGNVALVKEENFAIKNVALIKEKKDLKNKFLLYYFDSYIFKKYLSLMNAGGTQKFIALGNIRNFLINLPSLFEQQKISDFLSFIDNKLSLTEEKLENMKEYKKGIMQQIFSQEIRFKDDEGKDYPEWEEKRLGEIIIKNKEKNKLNKYLIVQTVSKKYGFVNQDEYFENRQVASKDLKNYYVIDNKAFAYNPSRINVGSLAYKKDNIISVISPLYISFYSEKNYLVDLFLLNWFSSNLFLKQMNSSFEGSVRNTLNYEALSRFKIFLPTLPEQQKIANFLTSIDDKITEVKESLKNLKTYKKGLLQKMFI